MNTYLFRPMDIQKDSGLVSSFLEETAAIEFYLKQGWMKIREEEGTPVIYRMGKMIDA